MGAAPYMDATYLIVRMGATYLIVALLRIDTKSYPQCSNAVRGTHDGANHTHAHETGQTGANRGKPWRQSPAKWDGEPILEA
jgi:hypothetical protein